MKILEFFLIANLILAPILFALFNQVHKRYFGYKTSWKDCNLKRSVGIALVLLNMFFGLCFLADWMEKDTEDMKKQKLQNARIANCVLVQREYQSPNTGFVKYLTTFDCGDNGFLVSSDPTIFQYAKKETKLRISGNTIIEFAE